MPNINTAYRWAINTCNNPKVGYSQSYRAQQTVNGITYYDCSSFIWYALKAGGFELSGYPFTTANMTAKLEELGFTRLSTTVDWFPGDILHVRNSSHQHTEMVSSGRRTMGAHTGKKPLADQVSINDYDTPLDYYTSLWRYAGGASIDYDWIKGNRYLNESEMQNNAYIFFSIMSARGWTLNAIAGTLGNIEQESTVNPGLWQNLTVATGNGFGLVQWTPSTNYTNWANSHGYAVDDGNYQCQWLDENTVSSGQWISTATYPMSFDEYKTSDLLPETLASVFLKNFERAGVEVEETRKTNARKWYDYLLGLSPIIPTTKKKSMPIYMMTRRVI